MAQNGLDFARTASVIAVMPELTTIADQTSITSKFLAEIWMRLDEADQLATSAAALESLPRIAALADQAALLARALELVIEPADGQL